MSGSLPAAGLLLLRLLLLLPRLLPLLLLLLLRLLPLLPRLLPMLPRLLLILPRLLLLLLRLLLLMTVCPHCIRVGGQRSESPHRRSPAVGPPPTDRIGVAFVEDVA